MPVDYEIDPGKRLIRTRCRGVVTFDEVLAHFQALSRDGQLPGSPDVLLDLTELSTHPDRDQVRSVALEVGRLLPEVEWGRCVIVARDDLTFGIGRMFGMLSEPYFSDVLVVRSHDEAEKWLASGPPTR